MDYIQCFKINSLTLRFEGLEIDVDSWAEIPVRYKIGQHSWATNDTDNKFIVNSIMKIYAEPSNIFVSIDTMKECLLRKVNV